jgi:hypothetical protein
MEVASVSAHTVMPLQYDYDEVHQISTRSIFSSITPNAIQRTTSFLGVVVIRIIGMPFLSAFPFLYIPELPINLMNVYLQVYAVF